MVDEWDVKRVLVVITGCRRRVLAWGLVKGGIEGTMSKPLPSSIIDLYQRSKAASMPSLEAYN